MSDCGNRGLRPKYKLGLYVPHNSDWSSFPFEVFCVATRGTNPVRSQNSRIRWQVSCGASTNKELRFNEMTSQDRENVCETIIHSRAQVFRVRDKLNEQEVGKEDGKTEESTSTRRP